MSRKKNKGGGGGGGGGHDGAGGLRWLLTYADLITLLVAFFVVMFAISNADLKKFQTLSTSLSNAFNINKGGKNPITSSNGGAINTPYPQPGQRQLSQEQLDRIIQEKLKEEEQKKQENSQFAKIKVKIEGSAREQGVSAYVHLLIDERGLIISIEDTVFFETGKAELRPDAKVVLDKVAGIIKDIPNQIRIEGHTDNVPIKTARYRSNWQLSTDRATTVLEYFINNHGYQPERLSAAGYGEYRPKVPNDSDEHRALNRRVDIVILRSDASEAKE